MRFKRNRSKLIVLLALAVLAALIIAQPLRSRGAGANGLDPYQGTVPVAVK